MLLQHLRVETLILTGLTSNSCITVTAHDANMRGFDIYIPPDCSCARAVEEHTQALAQLRATAAVKLRRSSSLKLPNLIRAAQISALHEKRKIDLSAFSKSRWKKQALHEPIGRDLPVQHRGPGAASLRDIGR